MATIFRVERKGKEILNSYNDPCGRVYETIGTMVLENDHTIEFASETQMLHEVAQTLDIPITELVLIQER